MKKIFLIIFLTLIVSSVKSQSISKYVSASVSFSNTDKDAPNIATASYFMIEGGISYKELSLGLGLGKSSFNFPYADGNPNEYFIEPKASLNFFEKGIFKGFGMVGVGTYFSTSELFIEYGAGSTISLKPADLVLQYSNWDGRNYISIGLSKSF